MRFFIFILMLLFAGSLFAQDTLRTRDRDNFQGKEQKKEQKQLNQKNQEQERKQDRFIDLDGDGINDEAMHRWQHMIHGQNGQHIDGNVEGQGEMNRNQNRLQLKGDPLGEPAKTQTKNGTKGKGKK